MSKCKIQALVHLTPFPKNSTLSLDTPWVPREGEARPGDPVSPQPRGPALAPVCDLVLIPLGLAREEVVVGHIRVATAWLPHGLDGALVKVARLG